MGLVLMSVFLSSAALHAFPVQQCLGDARLRSGVVPSHSANPAGAGTTSTALPRSFSTSTCARAASASLALLRPSPPLRPRRCARAYRAGACSGCYRARRRSRPAAMGPSKAGRTRRAKSTRCADARSLGTSNWTWPMQFSTARAPGVARVPGYARRVLGPHLYGGHGSPSEPSGCLHQSPVIYVKL